MKYSTEIVREIRAVVRTTLKECMTMRRFRWDLYYPWYFLADLVLWGAIIAAVIWWFR